MKMQPSKEKEGEQGDMPSSPAGSIYNQTMTLSRIAMQTALALEGAQGHAAVAKMQLLQAQSCLSRLEDELGKIRGIKGDILTDFFEAMTLLKMAERSLAISIGVKVDLMGDG